MIRKACCVVRTRNTGATSFTIDKAAAENPDKKLSDWVVASYKEKEAKEGSEKESANPASD